MIQSIKNTLKRLSGKIYIFNPIEWYPKLIAGLAVEFGRVRDFKNQVLSATVANPNMSVDAIDDYNKKYGIPDTLSGTDQEKICRIMEKASLNGQPGPDWLEDQLQSSGFILYVRENKPLIANVRQYGNYQYSISVQYGLTSRFINPDTIPGEIVVGSPPGGGGRLYLNQYGTTQYGTVGVEYGTKDPDSLNPQPLKYIRTDNPKYWGFYFVLSPFPDRLAVDENEFLSYTKNEFNYLKNLIIELKMQRNWCVLQAKLT